MSFLVSLLFIIEFALFPVKEIIYSTFSVNFSIITIILYLCEFSLVAYLVFYQINNNTYDLYKVDILFILLMLFIISVMVAHVDYRGYSHDGNLVSTITEYKIVTYRFIIFYLMGRLCLNISDFFVSNYFKCFIYMIFSFLFLLYLGPGFNFTESGINYLDISDRMIILMFVVLIFNKNKWFLTLISIVLIFILNSRSNFVFYTTSLLLSLFLFSQDKRLPFFYLCLVVVLYVLFVSFNAEIISYLRYSGVDERFVSLLSFTELSNDPSQLGRIAYFKHGFQDILNNPILGSFGGQLSSSGPGGERWGAFMHSAISYWRQFGLIVMLLVAYYLLILPTTPKIRLYYNFNIYIASFVFYTVFSAIFTKAFLWAGFSFYCGFLVSLLVNRNKFESLNS